MSSEHFQEFSMQWLDIKGALEYRGFRFSSTLAIVGF